MASALIEGFISKSGIKASDITATDVSSSRLKMLSRRYKGIRVTSDNISAVRSADVIFLCVKPKDFEGVLSEIAPYLNPSKHLVVSIAAGITLDFIQTRLPLGARVIRTMPNTPISVGEGVVFIIGGKSAKRQDVDFVSKVLSPVALVIKVKDEKLINSATAVSGSGPAYVYYFAEALIDAAMRIGFDERTASAIVLKTFSGAARMMEYGAKDNRKPGDLRADVTSPGGTTFEAITSFEKSHFKTAVLKAVAAARRRAFELCKN